MTMEKKTEVDKIEVIGAFKHVSVRFATWVEDAGQVVGAKSYHRKMIAPGDDYGDEKPDVQGVCAAVHSQDVIDAYNAHLAEQENV